MVESPEDVVCELRLEGRRRAPEVVGRDAEPLVHGAVDRVVLVAELLGGQALLDRLRLRRGPVLVRPADEQRPVATSATVPVSRPGRDRV